MARCFFGQGEMTSSEPGQCAWGQDSPRGEGCRGHSFSRSGSWHVLIGTSPPFYGGFWNILQGHQWVAPRVSLLPLPHMPTKEEAGERNICSSPRRLKNKSQNTHKKTSQEGGGGGVGRIRNPHHGLLVGAVTGGRHAKPSRFTVRRLGNTIFPPVL